jgi:hypothetical protein
VTNTGHNLYVRSITSDPTIASHRREGGEKWYPVTPTYAPTAEQEIETGQRWVREKVYEPALAGREPQYRRYHAELFDGQQLSCWERHLLQADKADSPRKLEDGVSQR